MKMKKIIALRKTLLLIISLASFQPTLALSEVSQLGMRWTYGNIETDFYSLIRYK